MTRPPPTTRSEPERRFLTGTAPKLTGRTISSYAAKFNVRSENMGTVASPIYEIIQPGAFDGRLNDDVRALFNHDNNLILARSKNGRESLGLKIDATGLFYQLEAPNTTAGNDLLESIRRGDVDQSSFSFSVAPGGDAWRAEGQGMVRTITKLEQLFDCSPVVSPAYGTTTVTARHKPAGAPATRPGEHPTIQQARHRLNLLEMTNH